MRQFKLLRVTSVCGVLAISSLGSAVLAQQSGLAPAPPPPPQAPDHTTITPGMVTPGSVPGTPNPAHNPSQQPLPSAPGVIVTIPIGRNK
jgi:hypothetical protein